MSNPAIVEMIHCNNCGKEINFNKEEINSEIVFCPECGAKNDISLVMNCIKDVSDEAPAIEKDSHNIEENAAADDPRTDQRTVQPDPEKEKASAKETSQNASPFAEIDEAEEEKQIVEKISSRTSVWRSAIKNLDNDTSVFTDNFAQGMPEWDLTPPDIFVQRRAAKTDTK